MLDNKTISEYTDYLVANLAYNMMNILQSCEGIQIFERLNEIDLKDSNFRYEIEVVAEFLGLEIPLGKVPLTSKNYEDALKDESLIRQSVETLIENSSGIKTLEKFEKEQLEKENKKNIFTIVK